MITIIDYGMGNLGSIANMFRKIGVETVISSDISVIAKADKLVLPGVGAFDNGMRNLAERGLIEPLNDLVKDKRKPVIGLCLGMQLLANNSEEGNLPGLGWVDAGVVKFNFDDENKNLKIPHMGWNTISKFQYHPLLEDFEAEARFYFVHAFHLVCKNEEDIIARTEYGYLFPSIIAKDNIIGVQFHPEKSHKFGMKLLKNFAEREMA
jgi:glutamine amidotransferase